MSGWRHEIIHFGGRVQGVGFRYTTTQVAREFEVAGEVRNLLDGRVRLEVQGAGAEIDALVETIQDRMHGFVRKIEREPAAGEKRFTGFIIKG